MNLTGIITLDSEFRESVRTVLAELRKEEPLPVLVNGLSGGATLAYLCESIRASKAAAPALVVVESDARATELAHRLSSLGLCAQALPERELVFFNISASHDGERERLEVLSRVLSSEIDAVVATPSALSVYTPPPERIKAHSCTLSVGGNLSPGALVDSLEAFGYARVDLVEAAGQYARRGGIVDFYSSLGAVRVEFFGDEIDRLTAFDEKTQRSTEPISSAVLTPALEFMPNAEDKAVISSYIEGLIKSCPDEQTKSALRRELLSLSEGTQLFARDKYLSVVFRGKHTPLDYFREAGGAIVYILGTAECRKQLRGASEKLARITEGLWQNGLVLKRDADYSLGEAELFSALSLMPTVHINAFAGVSGIAKEAGIFGFRCRRCVGYGDNARMLFEDLSGYIASGYRIILECENARSQRILKDELTERGYSATVSEGEIDISSLAVGGILLTLGDIEGFDLITPRVVLLSMKKDEGRLVMRKRREARVMKRLGGAVSRLMSHNDLSVGDYVVHANYGIGLFEGISPVRVDGVVKDYITIRYQGTDKLFVPCDRIELIGKYIGQRDDDGSVKLSKMGGADWHRTKSRAKASVKDIAQKLIDIYARRQRMPGFAFLEYPELEEEFAASFNHRETDSQIQATEEILSDMSKSIPMNRLLLGDVGFGKTEVALRAAMRAVLSGKQVAFLVPTTILALQHYTTATARFRGFAVNIEMISRHKTKSEQKKILDRLKRGGVDILIGTHKLLSSGIKFKDLGLLIVDEEQRFGVSQKERLKELGENIDVLTLTATPIPRTLNMSMNGICDMSILDDAPENRRPPQTFVLERDDMVIAEAIKKELSRGGQVLYLYNNIADIEYRAAQLSSMSPEARIAVAHGKMDRDEIEDIWSGLALGEIDILVCTTIIETGIDLPNANTLIIENADKMGLSQLHQLRGRVGRSDRQAYAYFTYRPGKALTDIARKRLSAIREYAEFGAGFGIAMCDLEIRGAGNLLGIEQHGYIDSVGYDLYIKLLSEAVLEAKGEARAEEFESVVDFAVDAHIPERYVQSSSGRMEIYKRISYIQTEEDMRELCDEITDRYGDMPKSVSRLLTVALCRALQVRARITKSTLIAGKIFIKCERHEIDRWARVMEKYPKRLVGISSPHGSVMYLLSAKEEPLAALLSVLNEYTKTENNSESEGK